MGECPAGICVDLAKEEHGEYALISTTCDVMRIGQD